MYMCVHVCIYHVCMNMYVHRGVCVYMYMYLCVCLCMFESFALFLFYYAVVFFVFVLFFKFEEFPQIHHNDIRLFVNQLWLSLEQCAEC